MSLADRIVKIARGLIGVQAGEPSTHVRFVEILGIPPVGQSWEPMLATPFSLTENPDGSFRTTGVSTCALVARGILREAGVLDPTFEQPYVPASAIADLVGFAKENGALYINGQRMPEPSDVLVVNNGGHVCTVVEDLGDSFLTVDGGLVGAGGLQAINTRERSKSLVPSWMVIHSAALPHKDPVFDGVGEWMAAIAILGGVWYYLRNKVWR